MANIDKSEICESERNEMSGSYRDKAIVPSKPEVMLAEIANQAQLQKKHAKEIALNNRICKIADKLNDSILPKVAKKGKNYYVFRFPIWFRIYYFNSIHEAYVLLKEKMVYMSYQNVSFEERFDIGSYYYYSGLSFRW